MNFPLDIAYKSNGVDIIKKILLMTKGRSIYNIWKGNIVIFKYNGARITQFQEFLYTSTQIHMFDLRSILFYN